LTSFPRFLLSDFFLTGTNATKIVDACPDRQWRLIFALWRFAGLRKMEIFQLRWEHVLWDQGRMLVTIPKTKHHEGKGTRFVPIGGILPWLEAAFHEAPDGSQRVITRFTKSNVNLAKPFEKIITAAGLTIWPKLIQNLRASCETDWLDASIPAHVVARWIGHSVKIQNDHYAQVDDHHFDQFNVKAKALQIQAAAEGVDSKRGGAQAGAQAVQTHANGQTSKKVSPPKNQCFSGDFSPVAPSAEQSIVPGGGRTCNLRLRRATLYPVELPRLVIKTRGFYSFLFCSGFQCDDNRRKKPIPESSGQRTRKILSRIPFICTPERSVVQKD